MRIQHNIAAMNAYRNYTNNVGSISKNLEKLSSGYKINRAGDDAAGLAVSEKMRLQISGLEQAQKNAKSAISYVQTAEGALTEVHDMLNRMYTLAEQSANGTFDNDTDRTQIQKEVNNLMEEINRIGKTANFNGIGIFADYAGGTEETEEAATFYTASDVIIAGATITGADEPKVEAAEAKKAKYTFQMTATLEAASDATTSFLGVTITVGSGGDVDTDNVTDIAGQIAAIVDKLNDDSTFSGKYTASVEGTDSIVVEALEAGVDESADDTKAAEVTGKIGTPTETVAGAAAVAEVPAHKSYNLSGSMKADDTITVEGKTYTFATDADGKDGATFKDLATLKEAMKVNGVEADITNANKVTFKKAEAEGDGGGAAKGDISFWIGAENIGNGANKLTIKAMHLNVGNLSIDDVYNNVGKDVYSKVEDGNIKDIDLTTADKAMDALKTIKTASESVSNMRGTLGAMQNRLDHTINNLSVMQENMQDAESVIRDTDVAEEMMAYTKNNILVQSAQAMLAQANQIPQGVLQLLG